MVEWQNIGPTTSRVPVRIPGAGHRGLLAGYSFLLYSTLVQIRQSPPPPPSLPTLDRATSLRSDFGNFGLLAVSCCTAMKIVFSTLLALSLSLSLSLYIWAWGGGGRTRKPGLAPIRLISEKKIVPGWGGGVFVCFSHSFRMKRAFQRAIGWVPTQR